MEPLQARSRNNWRRPPEETVKHRANGSLSRQAFALIATTFCAAGQASRPHPDLQGIWTNSTLTPLERTAEFRDKPTLTAAEASAYEKQAIEQGNRDLRASDP